MEETSTVHIAVINIVLYHGKEPKLVYVEISTNQVALINGCQSIYKLLFSEMIIWLELLIRQWLFLPIPRGATILRNVL